MADSAALNANIYDWGTAGPERVAEITRVLKDRFHLGDWGLSDSGNIVLGRSFGGSEVPTGTVEDLRDFLAEALPCGRWAIWQDPVWDALGWLFAWHPEFWMYEANCTSDGTPVFSGDAVRYAVKTGELRGLLGEAWGF